MQAAREAFVTVLAVDPGPTESAIVAYDGQRILYAKHLPNEEMLVAINLSNRPFEGSIELHGDRGFVEVTPDVASPLPPDAPAPERAARKREVNLPKIKLGAWEYRMFERSLK